MLSAYRPVTGPGFAKGKTGRRTWQPWLTALGAVAGVYVIRNKNSHDTLYVGRSFTNLRKTITRHLQPWSGPTAGALFRRGENRPDNLEIAVDEMSPGTTEKKRQAILDREAKLIKRLKPADNKHQPQFPVATPKMNLPDLDF